MAKVANYYSMAMAVFGAIVYAQLISVAVSTRVLPLHPYLNGQEKPISSIFDTSNYGILQLSNGLATTPQMGLVT